jgi:hypothetical protein
MYRRSRFLDALIAIRQEMAREADYDVDLFVERARSGKSTVGRYEIKEGRPRSGTNPSGGAKQGSSD